jgi:hypothetical protein
VGTYPEALDMTEAYREPSREGRSGEQCPLLAPYRGGLTDRPVHLFRDALPRDSPKRTCLEVFLVSLVGAWSVL